MFEINVFRQSRMIHAALPGMRKRRTGVIVNFSSNCGLQSFPGTGYALEAALSAWRVHGRSIACGGISNTCEHGCGAAFALLQHENKTAADKGAERW